MIRPVSKPVFAFPGETAIIDAVLKERANNFGNFSLETANEAGFWGAAVNQLPAQTVVPKGMQMPALSAILHEQEKSKTIKFKCEYRTWIRVVQYLPEGEKTSVSAKISFNRSWKQKLARLFSFEKIAKPEERIF